MRVNLVRFFSPLFFNECLHFEINASSLLLNGTGSISSFKRYVNGVNWSKFKYEKCLSFLVLFPSTRERERESESFYIIDLKFFLSREPLSRSEYSDRLSC